MKLLDLVPGWAWAAALVVLLANNVSSYSKLAAERLSHQTTQTAYAQQVAAAETQRADLEAQRRTTEQELQNAQAVHAQEVAALSVQRDNARAVGRVAADRLRDAARAAAQRAGQVCADSTATELREAAGDAIDVLADVLGRIDERAQELADIADQRGIAGRACEREYERAREALMR